MSISWRNLSTDSNKVHEPFKTKIFRKLKGAEEKTMSDNNPPKRLKRVEEKHLSDSNNPQMKYDVFVNFRGEEIRDGFLSHLIKELERKKINAFVDTKLEKGEAIWPSLVEAIERSSISLIIFSPDYASSRWCLDELVTILRCKETSRQDVVIPVFYKVEPTDVGHQSSKSYMDAFVEHERKHESKVQIWRGALETTAKLSGIVSSNHRTDAEIVEEIVNQVLKKLPERFVMSKGLVGIDQKVAHVESLIHKESNNNRLIGIWGMGGIGKTTLAEEVFNKLRFEYEGSKLVLIGRKLPGNGRIISLKNKIFSELLGNDVKIDTLNSLPGDIARRIGRMKVLIVLDDVNDSSHPVKLLGDLDNFGSGSTIIITTRDKHVLEANNAHEIYQVSELSSDEALELFNLNAFNQMDHQKEEYHELSIRMVHYAKGSPLVVTVLARRLRGKNKEMWESELDKLNKMPPEEVYDVMKLSYVDLDRKEKQTFLDLACFFFKLHRMVKVDHLKSLLKDDRDNSVAVTLERLKDKALVTLSDDKFISMHDSLQEMGLEIVQSEDHRSRSWLWNPEDICEALENDKGTKAIRSIQIDLMKIKEQKLSPDIFTNMSQLKFLEIYNGSYQHNILAEGLHLRFLSLYSYPLESLPKNFSTEELVILKLRGGRMEKLWDGVKNLVNLKELDLSQSRRIKELPDLSKATNLEVLLLWGCSELVEVHPSIFSLPKLEKLDLWNCTSLRKLVSDSRLQSLTYLNLDGCKKLQEFSVISEHMIDLRLECIKAKRHPSSFGYQGNPRSLHLEGCETCVIRRLNLSFMTQLLNLNLSNCSELETIVDLPPFLETLHVKNCPRLHTIPKLPMSLKTLNVQECHLKSLPEFPPSFKTLHLFTVSIKSLPKLPLSLEILNAHNCTLLGALPDLPQYIKTLDVNGTPLQTLPKLPQCLETLNVCNSWLKSLPELPTSLKTLDAHLCSYLQTLPKLPMFLNTLDVHYCYSLQALPELPLSLKTLDVHNCSSLLTLSELPMSLKTLDAHNCFSLLTLPELPMSLKTLDVHNCSSLLTLPELPMSLETLDVHNCSSLLTLPELPTSLKTLDVQSCSSLQILPKVPTSFEILDVGWCSSLQTLIEHPVSLQTLKAHWCSSLRILSELPPSLKTLDARYSKSLHTLGELPQSLETLNVRKCTSLETLPKLPHSIKTLDVSLCILQTLPELPLSLKTLYVYKSSLKSLPDLPTSLKTLDAHNCSSLQTLPELPMSLETLDVCNCSSLQALPELPLSLKTLYVYNCSSLQTLPEIPMSLNTLDVFNCSSLLTLPELPRSLKTLDARNCSSLQTLPELPMSLETLDVHNCSSLQTLPELPMSLKTLDVYNCSSLQTLPEIPMSLKTLDVHNCSSLLTLPELPMSLETLDAHNCSSLQTLPELPMSLKTLDVHNCSSLQTLPELPMSLKTVDVHNCSSLQTLPELPMSLKTVDVHNCSSLLTLPELPMRSEIHKT